MNKHLRHIPYLLISAGAALSAATVGPDVQPAGLAQETTVSPWQVTKRTALESFWVSTVSTPRPGAKTGAPVIRQRRFVQIGSGLNCRNEAGEWVEARPEFRLTERGAELTGAAFTLSLAADINTEGAVHVVMPSGQETRSGPLTVGYTDPADGRFEPLAVVSSVVGWLVPPDMIVYSNCFVGNGLRASLLYRVSRAGFSQNLLIHEAPAVTPEALGMSSAARLELLTVFTPDSAQPTRTVRALGGGLTDETLSFDTSGTNGGMQIGPGRALPLARPRTSSGPTCGPATRVS